MGKRPPPLSRFQVNGVSAASVPAGHASSVHTQHYMPWRRVSNLKGLYVILILIFLPKVIIGVLRGGGQGGLAPPPPPKIG